MSVGHACHRSKDKARGIQRGPKHRHSQYSELGEWSIAGASGRLCVERQMERQAMTMPHAQYSKLGECGVAGWVGGSCVERQFMPQVKEHGERGAMELGLGLRITTSN